MSFRRRAYDASIGRAFAAVYERTLAAAEEGGLREHRRGLLAGAAGRTVEIGAGTGLNLAHYPETIDELILTEPFPPMAKRLREHAGATATVIEAPADRLPIPDGSATTAVATLVLCTVDDVPATLAEVSRILEPGGRLLFVEHVRSEDPDLARWQDRLRGPWQFVGHGCRCNRDTVAAIEASPFEIESVEHGKFPKSPPIVHPLVVGSARKPA